LAVDALLGGGPLARGLGALLVAPAPPPAIPPPNKARDGGRRFDVIGLAGRRWRRTEAERLRAGSQVVRTARGLVEHAVEGDGSPLLVVHGTPGGYDQGVGIGRLLGGAFRVIAPSRPGYLRTPLAGNRSPEDQADILFALLDELGVGRVAVLGLSGGGAVAAACARARPERVDRLVLWQPVLSPLPLDAEALATRLVVANDAVEWLIAGALWCCSPLPELPRMLRDPALRRAVQAVAVSGFPLAFRQAGIRNDAGQFARLRPDSVAAIACPTLLVHGTDDPLVPFAHSERATDLMPDARLLPIPNGNHQTTLLAAEAVAGIRAFLGASA
jgi:pimeloyl-ACP methyl ester carboxylesterase